MTFNVYIRTIYFMFWGFKMLSSMCFYNQQNHLGQRIVAGVRLIGLRAVQSIRSASESDKQLYSRRFRSILDLVIKYLELKRNQNTG